MGTDYALWFLVSLGVFMGLCAFRAEHNSGFMVYAAISAISFGMAAAIN